VYMVDVIIITREGKGVSKKKGKGRAGQGTAAACIDICWEAAKAGQMNNGTLTILLEHFLSSFGLELRVFVRIYLYVDPPNEHVILVRSRKQREWHTTGWYRSSMYIFAVNE
jgi:hypothetical protein